MLNAKHVKRKRIRPRRDDAVLCNDAVLFAPAYEFPSEEQQRSFALIDEHQPVYRSAAAAPGSAGVAVTDHHLSPFLAHDHFAPREALLEGQEFAGVMALRADYRKNGQVLVTDGVQQPPVAFCLWGGRARTGGGPKESERCHAEGRESEERTANQGVQRAFHCFLLTCGGHTCRT